MNIFLFDMCKFYRIKILFPSVLLLEAEGCYKSESEKHASLFSPSPLGFHLVFFRLTTGPRLTESTSIDID